VPDCIRLAKASQNCQVRDELLLLGIPFCQSASDATTLVSKAAYESTKKRILDEYSRCARFSTIHSSRSQEGLEEQLDGLLDLPVGVENYACARITNEAHGEAAGQFAAPRLIEQAASQSGPHSVQFRLAHRALEAQ
jgi:hypothetical protein